MTGGTHAQRKAAARQLARAARCALSDEHCRAADAAIARLLLAMPELADARVVLAYNALREEVDLAPALTALRERGTAIAYPRVESPGVLGLHLVTEETLLVPGPMGLTEPAADTPRVPRETIDAVLVPGVAFDQHGWRLGFGGGFYDRLLPTLRPECVTIGIAYDEQVLTDLPSEDHDQRVDAVVTPTRVIRFAG